MAADGLASGPLGGARRGVVRRHHPAAVVGGAVRRGRRGARGLRAHAAAGLAPLPRRRDGPAVLLSGERRRDGVRWVGRGRKSLRPLLRLRVGGYVQLCQRE